MKTKILFVIPSMGSGGAEKSLATLLSLFNYEKYEVDLLTFRREGLFYNNIPKNVHVINGTDKYEIFDGDAKKAIKYFVKKFDFVSAFDRVKYANTFDETKRWKYLKRQLPKIRDTYDCAIGYLEGNASKFVLENVNANKKIIYVHNDFKKLGLDKEISKKMFGQADKVVTVSAQCLESLYDEFPDIKDKFCIIENITGPTILKKEAKEKAAYGDRTNDEIRLLTVGRFYPQKAIDLAVRACAVLKDRGRNIKWYHIGSGGLENEVRSLANDLNVNDSFIMLGEKSNPYPYIGQCDIYVQPSKFEGKSIAIDEAKCLCRPIVVTNFSTVFDQIEDGVNGIICNMDENDMADKIEYLIDNPQKREELSKELSLENTGNEDEIYKLYELIDN